MIDKATYDDMASRLEHNLRRGSRIDWHVDRYDERLGEACISEEAAQGLNTTPDAHFKFTYEQIVVRFKVLIGIESLRGKLYVARVLVEDVLLHHIDVIRQMAAGEIVLKLVEDSIV